MDTNDLIPIKDNLGLMRDPKTHAIVNSSSSQYQNYLRLKKQKEIEGGKIRNIEEEMDSIKDELSEIKNLLRSLINESK
jgi:hypothetical protein